MNQSRFSRAEGSNDAQSDIGHPPGQRPFLAVDEWIWKKNKKIQLTLDVVSVKKMVKKAKNTGRNNKISLYKNFKLILGQNVIEQTYPKITFSLQKSPI